MKFSATIFAKNAAIFQVSGETKLSYLDITFVIKTAFFSAVSSCKTDTDLPRIFPIMMSRVDHFLELSAENKKNFLALFDKFYTIEVDMDLEIPSTVAEMFS